MRKHSLPDRPSRCHEGKHTPYSPSVPGWTVSLYAARRGSLTVEAAWVLPLFFLAMASLICMMELYGIFAETTVRLQQNAEKAAMAASLLGNTDLPAIDLQEAVTYRPRWYPEALPAVTVTARGRARPWTGRTRGEGGPAEEEAEELVYVSERATVYHTSSSCTHLALTIHAVQGSAVDHMHNADGKRYHACEKCVGSGGRNQTVYVGENGDRFHNNASCSSLTRSVKLVKKSELAHLACCSRCQNSLTKVVAENDAA